MELDNPKRRNAISSTMWHELGAFAADVATRSDARVVMIRGSGGAFSAGADIFGFESARAGVSQAKAYDDMVEEVCRAFEAIPQPSLALIRGHCIGAGASLAASCDLRIASEDAYFAVPAARLGLGYDPRGVDRFVRVFGPGITRMMLYTAGRFPVAQAHSAGAVHMLCSSSGLDEAGAELARSIAANAPLTVRAAKVAIRATISNGDCGLAAQAQELAALADASADYIEGRRAFEGKRLPCFSGR